MLKYMAQFFWGLVPKAIIMKNVNQNPNNPRANPDTRSNNARPDVRDNLDSRKNEEQDFKGDDVTHNEKENKGEKLKKKES
jgi:hypothetical protein